MAASSYFLSLESLVSLPVTSHPYLSPGSLIHPSTNPLNDYWASAWVRWLSATPKCPLSPRFLLRPSSIPALPASTSLLSPTEPSQVPSRAVVAQPPTLAHQPYLLDPRSFPFLSSVQFSRPVVSNSLRPHEPQHTRRPCPSPIPGGGSNSCPLRRWCHPAISSSVVPFSSCPQSFPASRSFPVSQLLATGGQSIGSFSLRMNIQDWFPLGWTDWISLLSKGLSRVFTTTLSSSLPPKA